MSKSCAIAVDMEVSSDNNGESKRSDEITTVSNNGIKAPRAIKSELVFFSQVIIIYIVVCLCLFNLTTGHTQANLWSALLSGSLGYLLPNPKIKTK